MSNNQRLVYDFFSNPILFILVALWIVLQFVIYFYLEKALVKWLKTKPKVNAEKLKLLFLIGSILTFIGAFLVPGLIPDISLIPEAIGELSARALTLLGLIGWSLYFWSFRKKVVEVQKVRLSKKDKKLLDSKETRMHQRLFLSAVLVVVILVGIGSIV